MKNILRALIKEVLLSEIHQNMFTLDTSPNTWDSFQDFETEYYPQEDGTYLLDISYKGKKLGSMRKFPSHEDAKHAARMMIDNYRVKVMNK